MFYKTSRTAYDLAAAFDDELDAHMYAHTRAVYPLAKQRAELLAREETQRRQREAQFPPDVAAFEGLRNRDMKVRPSHGPAQRQR